jgi:hypothetical protein
MKTKVRGNRKVHRLESGHFMILSVVVCVCRNRTGGHRKVCRWGNSPLYDVVCIKKHIEKPNHKVELSFKIIYLFSFKRQFHFMIWFFDVFFDTRGVIKWATFPTVHFTMPSRPIPAYTDNHAKNHKVATFAAARFTMAPCLAFVRNFVQGGR